MKLPFEQLGSFVAWYIDPNFPIVITKSDFKRICDETEFSDPLESARLKMAVIGGTGTKEKVIKACRVFTETLSARIESNGWPYIYCFEGREAVPALDAYLSAFCFCNRRFSAHLSRTAIDNKASYTIKQRHYFKKIEVTSFSAEIVKRIVGPSVEFFAVLKEGDVLYFGSGKVKQLHLEQYQSLIESADYFDLMSYSHGER